MLLAVRKNIHTIVEHNLQTVVCERESHSRTALKTNVDVASERVA